MSFESDQHIISNMMDAMEELCTRLQPERVNQQALILIADAMIASAKAGKHSLIELYAAGLNAVLENEASRSSWFGLRRLWRRHEGCERREAPLSILEVPPKPRTN
jgi:hypothetical protein